MIFLFSLLVLNASNKEIGPTRPRYIVVMIIILPHRFKEGVKFLVRPTVAVALMVSYTISRALASVTADNNTVEVNITMKDTLVTATALLMACFEMVL